MLPARTVEPGPRRYAGTVLLPMSMRLIDPTISGERIDITGRLSTNCENLVKINHEYMNIT